MSEAIERRSSQSGVVATCVEAFCSREGDEANLLVCAMQRHSVPPINTSASLFSEDVVSAFA